jgi:hypothetical protein
MHGQSPKIPIFVNVNVDLFYAQIPGENPVEFYHYSKLKSADFSFNNIEKEKSAKIEGRNKIIPATFSFEYKIKEDDKKTKKQEEKKENKEENPEKAEKEILTQVEEVAGTEE